MFFGEWDVGSTTYSVQSQIRMETLNMLFSVHQHDFNNVLLMFAGVYSSVICGCTQLCPIYAVHVSCHCNSLLQYNNAVPSPGTYILGFGEGIITRSASSIRASQQNYQLQWKYVLIKSIFICFEHRNIKSQHLVVVCLAFGLGLFGRWKPTVSH